MSAQHLKNLGGYLEAHRHHELPCVVLQGASLGIGCTGQTTLEEQERHSASFTRCGHAHWLTSRHMLLARLSAHGMGLRVRDSRNAIYGIPAGPGSLWLDVGELDHLSPLF